MHIPASVRAGGAFLALALTLFILLFLAVLRDGWMSPFDITNRVLMILVAAVILGAFATQRTDQSFNRGHITALVIGVGLIMVSMVVPQVTVYVLAQYWLAMYAVLALLCALVLRRASLPAS